MKNIIENIEKKNKLKHTIPSFKSGDTIEIQSCILDGEKTRLQKFEGIVIAIKNRGFRSSFSVRKISNGEGVERIFKKYSPNIKKIKIKKYGKVKQSKLYYIRKLHGKSYKIKEKKNKKKFLQK
ncbi:50S ribosomal protein L19 [Buchnera aphidicola (Astegopteryx bambusae)]|uniref:50S ribosomal protein L19 n=1 Tax=Buchnera aphidicola TaxID=9 RepID=UPI0031B80CE3